jgi:hypothetical protein
MFNTLKNANSFRNLIGGRTTFVSIWLEQPKIGFIKTEGYDNVNKT